MSINAINGLSIYEYYYSINNNNKKKEAKKESPLASELEKYGLKATENEAYNVQLLKQAQANEKAQQEESSSTTSYTDRPWADIMYQLNIEFNEDPRDDIEDIKEELKKLTAGIDDEDFSKEIKDLENYVSDLYISYINTNSSSIDTSLSLTTQLNNLAIMNIANFT